MSEIQRIVLIALTQLLKCISSNGLNFNIHNKEWEGKMSYV